MYSPNDRVYYAQLKVPPGKPPVARLLEGDYVGPARRGGYSKVKFRYAPWPLTCPNQFLAEDVEIATKLLQQRIGGEISAHETLIAHLRHALQIALLPVIVQWPKTPADRRRYKRRR